MAMKMRVRTASTSSCALAPPDADSFASFQTLKTINPKGRAARPVPVRTSPMMLANAQPYIVVKISR